MRAQGDVLLAVRTGRRPCRPRRRACRPARGPTAPPAPGPTAPAPHPTGQGPERDPASPPRGPRQGARPRRPTAGPAFDVLLSARLSPGPPARRQLTFLVRWLTCCSGRNLRMSDRPERGRPSSAPAARAPYCADQVRGSAPVATRHPGPGIRPPCGAPLPERGKRGSPDVLEYARPAARHPPRTVARPYDGVVRCARSDVQPGGFHTFTHFHARAHAAAGGRTAVSAGPRAACTVRRLARTAVVARGRTTAGAGAHPCGG